MRRWFCVIALLYGFAGDGYAWTARPRPPVAIERNLDSSPDRRTLRPTEAWWLAH